MSVDQREIDEVLEAIWVAREDNKTSIKNVKTICSGDATDEVDVERTLSELERLEMVKSHGDTVEFLASGEKHAEGVIRRHRLAERLFTDVLQVSDAAVELTACQFEHILSSEVVDSVCAFLGHPPLCPHGKAIPSGDCCKTYHKEELKPLIIRLADLEIGKDAEIAFITPSFHKRYDRLTALGVIAGNPIKVHQREPSFVVRIGETELAIEKVVAQEIYVKAP